MKVAIPSTGESLNDSISPDFGRAPFLQIIDQDTETSRVLPNPHLDSPECAGALVVEMLNREGVKLILTSSCGENAAQAMQDAEIKLVTGASGTVQEVFDKYKKGAILDRVEPSDCSECELIRETILAVVKKMLKEEPMNPRAENNGMKISVASGKGGTGKTLVSTSLALSINEEWQFLDCDVEEPNAHVFLQPELKQTEPVLLPVPVIDPAECIGCGDCAAFCQYNALAVVKEKALVFYELCHSCGGCKLVCPEDAISEEMREIGIVEIGDCNGMLVIDGLLNVGEALAPPIIKAVKDRAQPGVLTIIDSPPGTACPMIDTVKDTDYCILVTEPTPFGLHDLKLAVGVVRELGIPCGVIVNRVDEKMKRRRQSLHLLAEPSSFGERKVFDYCQEENIPILMEIPLKREIAIAYSDGIPFVDAMPEWREKFSQLFEEIIKS